MLNAPEIQAALDWAADAIKAQDGGNPETETGWASDEALAHWLAIKALLKSPSPDTTP